MPGEKPVRFAFGRNRTVLRQIGRNRPCKPLPGEINWNQAPKSPAILPKASLLYHTRPRRGKTFLCFLSVARQAQAGFCRTSAKEKSSSAAAASRGRFPRFLQAKLLRKQRALQRPPQKKQGRTMVARCFTHRAAGRADAHCAPLRCRIGGCCNAPCCSDKPDWALSSAMAALRNRRDSRCPRRSCRTTTGS